jgi:hypothetical protein
MTAPVTPPMTPAAMLLLAFEGEVPGLSDNDADADGLDICDCVGCTVETGMPMKFRVSDVVEVSSALDMLGTVMLSSGSSDADNTAAASTD